MVYRFPSRQLVWAIPIAGLAIVISMELRRAARADVPRCGPAGCPNCPVNSKFFGYYPTLWRRWPGTEPLPQPSTAPATGGAEVPTVEPPPAMEEIETKKTPPPEAPAGGGGAATGPAADPNAKRPMPPNGNGNGANRFELPSPDAGEPGPLPTPAHINRLRPAWGNELAPLMTESLGPIISNPSSNSPTWPPANFLRKDEVRAGFQTTERPTKVETPSTLQPIGESGTLTVVGDAAKTAHEQPASTMPQSEPARHEIPSRSDANESATGALRWVDPTEPARRERNPAAPAAEKPCIQEHDISAASAARTSSTSLPNDSGAPSASTAARIPLMPRGSTQDPLPPLEPKSLTGAAAPVGRTPADAPSNQLVPSNRVSEVALPAALPAVKAAAAQPVAAGPQESLSRIDPLAIGKSLDSARPSGEAQERRERPASKDDFQFADGIAPPAPVQAPAGTSIAPQTTCAAPKSSKPAADAPCFGTPPVVVPPSQTMEADFAVPEARPAPAQAISATPFADGNVVTADFALADPVMPAKLTDINPLAATTAPGTGFPPLPANPSGSQRRATATVSDEVNGVRGAAQQVGYNRPNDAIRSPQKAQYPSRGRTAEAFSSDAGPSASTSVSDDSTPAPARKPLHWGR